jgi:hypothetical protein
MCSRSKNAFAKHLAHFWRPTAQQEDHPMPVLLLDLIFVAIGVAAFAITALYLGACDNL